MPEPISLPELIPVPRKAAGSSVLAQAGSHPSSGIPHLVPSLPESPSRPCGRRPVGRAETPVRTASWQPAELHKPRGAGGDRQTIYFTSVPGLRRTVSLQNWCRARARSCERSTRTHAQGRAGPQKLQPGRFQCFGWALKLPKPIFNTGQEQCREEGLCPHSWGCIPIPGAAGACGCPVP